MVATQTSADGKFEFPFWQLFRKVLLEVTSVLMADSSVSNSIENAQPDWRNEYPFQSNFMDLAGVRMHYVDEGSGRPVIMIHGNPTWSFYYRRLVSELSGEYRAIAVDHIGCGLSDKPTGYTYQLDTHISNLSRLIEELDLQNATLVAHDWGGAIGLGALLQHRERFERIVLFNTGAFPPPFIPWRIRACRIPLLGKLAVQGGNLFARAAVTMATSRRGGLESTTASGLLAPYDSWGNRTAIFNFVKDIPTRSNQPTWKTLERIESGLSDLKEMKKLLVWGMQDWCFRPECLERFIQHWPEATVRRIESANHYVVEDASDQVVDELKTFLQ